MSVIQSVILGLIQGLSEFLPISSSGHLAVSQHFMGIDPDSVLTFTVMLHFGTLLAIFIAFWKDIAALLKELGAVIADIFTGKGLQINKNETRKLGFMIIVASIPTGITGIVLKDFFEGLYSSMISIGIGLIVTGTFLFIAERSARGIKGVRESNLIDALVVGICQSLALCPGISRSGSTLVGGLFSGFNREHAVRFGFLVSIPAVLGAFLLELKDVIKESPSAGASFDIPVLVIGIAVAAVSGYAAIKVMISAVVNRKLIWFSLYTWIAGAALIIYSVLTHN